MHQPPREPIVYSPADLTGALAEFVLKAQKESIEKKGRFTLALSGGSLPKQLKSLIGNPNAKWDKW
jgi:6-phosphogluconolactonase